MTKMETFIQSIVTAMGIGASMEDIHDAAMERGWSEYDFFLAYKAAEMLYNDQVEFQKAQMKRATFRRMP